jgi:hypothetical protein
MLYQLAICRAARQLGLDVQICRRGQETSRAADQLGVTLSEIEEFVSRTGRPAGPPWTQEHRRAYAARHRGAGGSLARTAQDSATMTAERCCKISFPNSEA